MLWAVPAGHHKYGGYTVRVDLLNLGGGVCEASGAIGSLDEATLLGIGMKAVELGFRVLQSSAVKGSRVSRHLTYVGSDDDRDFYTVDLMAKLRELGIEV